MTYQLIILSTNPPTFAQLIIINAKKHKKKKQKT